MGKMLSPDEMIQKFPGTTRGYWSQLRFTGKGPQFFKPSAKRVFYDEADVDEWFATKVRTQTGAAVSA